MDILKNENIKNAAAVLWHKLLLAETVNDIILSEIKDRLHLQNVDEDWLMSPETSPRDTFMARVTDLAFGDVVEHLSAHASSRSRQARFLDADDAAVARIVGREIAGKANQIVGSAVLVSAGTL